MQRIERTAIVNAPPEEVFAYVSDLANLPEWMSGVVVAERTSGDAMGVGASVRVVRELMGQRVEAPLTVTVFEPPSRMAIGGNVSGVSATADLELAPSGEGATDLRFAMEIRGSGLTSFMEPMIAGAARGDVDASLARIQARFAGSD